MSLKLLKTLLDRILSSWPALSQGRTGDCRGFFQPTLFCVSTKLLNILGFQTHNQAGAELPEAL